MLLNKCWKIVFEDKGILIVYIEVKFLGVDNCYGMSELIIL